MGFSDGRWDGGSGCHGDVRLRRRERNFEEESLNERF